MSTTRSKGWMLTACLCAIVPAAGARAQEPTPGPSPEVAPVPSAEGAEATAVTADPDAAPDADGAGDEAADAGADTGPGDDDGDLGDLEGLEQLLDEQVVTTASRSAERASTAPATVVIIDAETLRRHGIRTLDEALAYLGVGVFTADSGRDYTSGVDTGVQGVLLRDRNRHLLVLVDGHVVNAQVSGDVPLDATLGISLDLLDHVELMLGPGSVSYGSNAVLGVVNLVTHGARGFGRMRASVEGTLGAPTGLGGEFVGPGSGHAFGGRIRAALGGGKAFRAFGRAGEIVVHGEFQQESGATFEMPILTGDSFDVRPGEPGWGGVARQAFTLGSGHLALRLGDARLMVEGGASRRALPLAGMFDESDAREVRSFVRFDLRHDADPAAKLALTSRLYGDVVRLDERTEWTRSFYCLPGQQLDGCVFQRRSASSWLGLEQQAVVDARLDGRFVTTVGYDLRYRFAEARPADYVDRVTGAPPYTAREPYWQSHRILGAVFVQEVMRFGEKVTVNLGARFDGDMLYGVHLSPRAAFTYLPRPETTLRIGFAEAFRAPSAQELFDTDPTYIVAPTSLGAEVVRAVDVEWAERFEHGSLSVRGFASFYDGLIALRVATMSEFDAAYAAGQLVDSADPAYVTVADNLDSIRAFGSTATARLEPTSRLRLSASMTAATSRTTDDSALPIIPTVYGNATVELVLGEDRHVLALASRFSSNRVAPNDTATGFVSRIDIGGSGRLRLTASGPLSADGRWTYRAFADTTLHRTEPYVYFPGPTPEAPDNVRALAPVQRLALFGGVSYALP